MENLTLHILALTAALATSSSPVNAACYADYKAKKGNPIQFHYGVIELPNGACSSKAKAAENIQNRIKVASWNLLNVISVFDQSGLAQRKQSAANYFLRF